MILDTKENRKDFIQKSLNIIYQNSIEEFKKNFATKQTYYNFFINDISVDFIRINEFIIDMINQFVLSNKVDGTIKGLINLTKNIEVEYNIQQTKLISNINKTNDNIEENNKIEKVEEHNKPEPSLQNLFNKVQLNKDIQNQNELNNIFIEKKVEDIEINKKEIEKNDSGLFISNNENIKDNNEEITKEELINIENEEELNNYIMEENVDINELELMNIQNQEEIEEKNEDLESILNDFEEEKIDNDNFEIEDDYYSQIEIIPPVEIEEIDYSDIDDIEEQEIYKIDNKIENNIEVIYTNQNELENNNNLINKDKILENIEIKEEKINIKEEESNNIDEIFLINKDKVNDFEERKVEESSKTIIDLLFDNKENDVVKNNLDEIFETNEIIKNENIPNNIEDLYIMFKKEQNKIKLELEREIEKLKRKIIKLEKID